MIGPVQLLVVGFAEPNFCGEVLDHLRSLREPVLAERARGLYAPERGSQSMNASLWTVTAQMTRPSTTSAITDHSG